MLNNLEDNLLRKNAHIILVQLDVSDSFVSKIGDYLDKKRRKDILLIKQNKIKEKYNNGVNDSDLEKLFKLYRIYEFSDRVILISKEKNYGDLFNYVNTGLISEREMLEALLE